MSEIADAWVLNARTNGEARRATLVRKQIEIDALTPDQVLAKPLYGCWEGNMGHSLDRKPIDICVLRGETDVVVGNAGVVRILKIGSDVKNFKPGDVAMLFPVGETDKHGYMTRALGYDAVGMGLLSSRVKLRERQLVLLPSPTRFSLAQWAAFSVRYVTAWANWQLAHAVFRLLLTKEDVPTPNVWGWGGGTTLAELDLARREGCRAVMLSASDANMATIRRAGVEVLDRRSFGALDHDPTRSTAPDYADAEAKFLAEVRERTNDDGIHIFVDLIGTPVFRATLRALARPGLVTSVGWKCGMNIAFNRATECLKHHQFVHTHYARYHQALEAMEYAERTGWMPEVGERIYTFDEIPQLAADYEQGRTGYFPCFEICPD